MRPSKLYPFTIPANGSVNLLVSGDYFKVKSSTGSLTVIGDSFGALAGLLAGQGLRDTDFSRLTLVDETGAQNSGFLLVSDGTFIDDRVTGEVSVIDGELFRSKSGSAFTLVANVTAVAGQFSYGEVWNPATSTKRVIVSDVALSCSAASSMILTKTTSVLTAATSGISKSSNPATSQAKTGSGTVVTFPGVAVDLINILAATPYTRFYKQPFILEPGNGLLLGSAVPNIGINGCIQFIEESI